MPALDAAAAIAAIRANEPWTNGDFKMGSIAGVVLCLRHGKVQGSFRVISEGKVQRAGLRRANSVSAGHIVRTLESAGYEMVD